MARPADIGRGWVVARLSARDVAVVTISAGARDFVVIHFGSGFPR